MHVSLSYPGIEITGALFPIKIGNILPAAEGVIMEMITKANFSNKSKSISYPFNWEIPPNRVSIKPGDVHIWKVDLKVIASHQDTGKILSTDEQERAARIVDPLRRGRFRSARFALRNILSLYEYLSPEAIELSYGKYGKPFIKQKALKCSI